jgi:hypothetical protein
MINKMIEVELWNILEIKLIIFDDRLRKAKLNRMISKFLAWVSEYKLATLPLIGTEKKESI